MHCCHVRKRLQPSGQEPHGHLHHCWLHNSQLWWLYCSEDLKENIHITPKHHLSFECNFGSKSVFTFIQQLEQQQPWQNINKRCQRGGVCLSDASICMCVMLPAQSHCWSNQPQHILIPHRSGLPLPPHLNTNTLITDWTLMSLINYKSDHYWLSTTLMGSAVESLLTLDMLVWFDALLAPTRLLVLVLDLTTRGLPVVLRFRWALTHMRTLWGDNCGWYIRHRHSYNSWIK